MRNTTIDSEVIVILDGKSHKGIIVDVLTPGAARIQLGDKGTVQASYSLSGEEGSFHYPGEKVRKTEKPQFAAAAPSTTASK